MDIDLNNRSYILHKKEFPENIFLWVEKFLKKIKGRLKISDSEYIPQSLKRYHKLIVTQPPLWSECPKGLTNNINGTLFHWRARERDLIPNFAKLEYFKFSGLSQVESDLFTILLNTCEPNFFDEICQGKLEIVKNIKYNS